MHFARFYDLHFCSHCHRHAYSLLVQSVDFVEIGIELCASGLCEQAVSFYLVELLKSLRFLLCIWIKSESQLV